MADAPKEIWRVKGCQLWTIYPEEHEVSERYVLGDRFMEWLPIETAPKDNKDILISVDVSLPNGPTNLVVVIGFWLSVSPDYEGLWISTEGGDRIYSPTHWMPLPEPPSGL